MVHGFIACVKGINRIRVYLDDLLAHLAVWHPDVALPSVLTTATVLSLIIITSTSDLQPSIAIANQLPGQ